MIPLQEPKKENGFVALISAIIISAALMAIVSSVSFLGYTGRFNILDAEFKEVSAGLAEACAELALLELSQNIAYAGNETKNINGNTCLIRPVLSSPPNKIIETQAISHDAYTNLRLTVDSTTLSVSSWEELPTF